MLGMPDCGQAALGDLLPITAIAPPMGMLDRCLSGILRRKAVLLLDRTNVVQLPLAGHSLLIANTMVHVTAWGFVACVGLPTPAA